MVQFVNGGIFKPWSSSWKPRFARLVRICSRKEDLESRFEELKVMLLSREYNKNIVEAAMNE